MSRTLGLDIGGANLKGATSDGVAAAMAFPLWKSPDRLADALAALTAPLPRCDRIAVTMTGELADCFATKQEGVDRILTALESWSNADISVWTTAGRFLTCEAARVDWPQVAAANWHAQATWAGRYAAHGSALLIDIGSTTTDLIRLRDGLLVTEGKTDLDRLQSGELLYTGVRRTPICAVTSSILLRGRSCLVAAELFATMLDAYLICGDVEENPADCETADGRPATREWALNRLAHMFCCDRTELTEADLVDAARRVVARQTRQICTAISELCERRGVLEYPSVVLLSGSGAFLVRERLSDLRCCRGAAVLSLSEQLSPALSESACAYAVAVLRAETGGA